MDEPRQENIRSNYSTAAIYEIMEATKPAAETRFWFENWQGQCRAGYKDKYSMLSQWFFIAPQPIENVVIEIFIHC